MVIHYLQLISRMTKQQIGLANYTKAQTLYMKSYLKPLWLQTFESGQYTDRHIHIHTNEYVQTPHN